MTKVKAKPVKTKKVKPRSVVSVGKPTLITGVGLDVVFQAVRGARAQFPVLKDGSIALNFTVSVPAMLYNSFNDVELVNHVRGLLIGQTSF